MSSIRRLNQRGDTIVEVLIAIAIVGAVLTIAYSIMNRNLQTMRDNQERTEASKIAQEQVETLKARWQVGTSRAQIAALGTNGFCFDPDDTTLRDMGMAVPNFDMFADDTTAYTDCTYNGIHRVGIRREGVADNYSYRIFVRWDRVGSGERQQAVLVYRLE